MELTGELRLRAFYECWTRKEAYLKATGIGLAGGLDSVRVTVAAAPPRIVSLAGDDAARWTLVDLDLGEGFAGAGRPPANREPALTPVPMAPPVAADPALALKHTGPGVQTVASQLTDFTEFCESRTGRRFPDHAAFHAFSVAEYPRFWSLFLEWSGSLHEGSAEPACTDERVRVRRLLPECAA